MPPLAIAETCSASADNVTFPARYASVIAVAATTRSDQRASFSSTGRDVEIAAPGVGIPSTFLGGGTATLSGTSMASPHVAGAAALVMANGDLTDLNGDLVVDHRDARIRLQRTADDLLPAGRDPLTGFGITDADEAAPQVVNRPPVANDDAETVPPNGSVAIAVLANDSDPDADPLTVTNLTSPANGTTTINQDQTVQYTPNLGFSGADVFTYTANDGQLDSNVATVSVTVGQPPPNVPPVANAGADQTVVAGQTVTLNGSLSFDVDGVIVSHSWDFGDGSGGPGEIVNHVYTSSSIFTAVLTVTDDDNASSTDAAIITVNPPSPNTIHVESIAMGLAKRFGGWRTFATASVEIRNQLGEPVQGVLVLGHWEGTTGDSDLATTGPDGTVTLKSDVVRKPPAGSTFTFVVDDVAKEDHTYNSAENQETQDSISP